jgi:integrase/recombinase XerC
MPDLLARFEQHLLVHCNPSTVKLRLQYMNQLQRDHPDLLAVTVDDLEHYFAARRQTHAPETRKSARASFRQFYQWAHDVGLVTVDPAVGLATIRVPVRVPRLADDDSIKAALATATAQERAIILLARLGCLRRAEIATLRVHDRRGDALIVKGKGEKQRIVYCNTQLLDALTELERSGRGDYYFVGHDGINHVVFDTIGSTIQRLTGWNAHSLRHAGATAAFRATHDLRAVQAMLGHASLATTERYLHLDEVAQRALATGVGLVA